MLVVSYIEIYNEVVTLSHVRSANKPTQVYYSYIDLKLPEKSYACD